MEEEMALRAYVEVLRHYWRWVVGLTVLAAVTALVVSLLLPPTYEARAIAIVTQPRYQIQFDPRFETANGQNPAYGAFPLLATSDGILQKVVEAYTPAPEARIKDWRLKVLSDMVNASAAGDPSLVSLQVRSRSAQAAAGIANRWADVLVREANATFRGNESDVAFFEDQARQAADTLGLTSQALIEFQARNPVSTISARLFALQQAQADYLAEKQAMARLSHDIQGLHQQLSGRPEDERVSLSDSLTALLLQIRAYNAEATAPIQLQIDPDGWLPDRTLAEQVALLNSLLAALEAKSAQIEARLEEIEPLVLDLQQELEAFSSESAALTQARDLAQETYVTLARKLDEARIAAQEEQGVMQIGSYAAIPEEPASPNVLLNTLFAGVVGLILGVITAFSLHSWHQSHPETQGGAS
jgi:uncharacterized protein involved in exopolysaccharide biosynthesis